MPFSKKTMATQESYRSGLTTWFVYNFFWHWAEREWKQLLLVETSFPSKSYQRPCGWICVSWTKLTSVGFLTQCYHWLPTLLTIDCKQDVPSTVRFPQTWQIFNRLPDSNLPEATVNSICAVLLNLCRLGSTAAISCRKEERSPTKSWNPTWGNLKVISSLVSPAWMAPSLTAWEPKSWPTTSPVSPFPSCGFLIINHSTMPHLLFSLNPSTILHTSVFSSSAILQTCIAPKIHSLACQQEDSLTRVGLKRG